MNTFVRFYRKRAIATALIVYNGIRYGTAAKIIKCANTQGVVRKIQIGCLHDYVVILYYFLNIFIQNRSDSGERDAVTPSNQKGGVKLIFQRFYRL